MCILLFYTSCMHGKKMLIFNLFCTLVPCLGVLIVFFPGFFNPLTLYYYITYVTCVFSNFNKQKNINISPFPILSLDARPQVLSTKDDLVLTTSNNMINRRRPQNPTQKEAGGGKMVANRYSCGDFSQLFSQQQQTQGATPLVKGHFHSHSDCGEYTYY